MLQEYIQDIKFTNQNEQKKYCFYKIDNIKDVDIKIISQEYKPEIHNVNIHDKYNCKCGCKHDYCMPILDSNNNLRTQETVIPLILRWKNNINYLSDNCNQLLTCIANYSQLNDCKHYKHGKLSYLSIKEHQDLYNLNEQKIHLTSIYSLKYVSNDLIMKIIYYADNLLRSMYYSWILSIFTLLKIILPILIIGIVMKFTYNKYIAMSLNKIQMINKHQQLCEQSKQKEEAKNIMQLESRAKQLEDLEEKKKKQQLRVVLYQDSDSHEWKTVTTMHKNRNKNKD